MKIRKDLRSILKKARITSIFVTHDENDAHALADRIVKLKDGSIELIGKPCDLLGNRPNNSIDSETTTPVNDLVNC